MEKGFSGAGGGEAASNFFLKKCVACMPPSRVCTGSRLGKLGGTNKQTVWGR